MIRAANRNSLFRPVLHISLFGAVFGANVDSVVAGDRHLDSILDSIWIPKDQLDWVGLGIELQWNIMNIVEYNGHCRTFEPGET